MIKINHIILVLLVIVASLMTYKIFLDDAGIVNLERANAQGASNSEIIAVPVQVDSNAENLFLLKKQSTRRMGKATPDEWHMVVYGMDGGRTLTVKAARLIEFDFYMQAYKIERNKNLQPEEMRKKVAKGTAPEKKK